MTATYEPTLPTDRDWVRLLIGDSTTATARLQDEEIDALLVEESNKYLAAARALEVLHTRWSSAGEGIVEKQVESLRIRRGVDQSASDALQARIEQLRRKGVWVEAPQSKVFRAV